MYKNLSRILPTIAGATLACAISAAAQAPATPAPAAPAPAAPAAPAAAPTWSVGPMDISGFIDGYYSFNFNRPNTSDPSSGYDQINQLYNFNDKTNQISLSAAKLTLNYDPNPVGAHLDLIFGERRTA